MKPYLNQGQYMMLTKVLKDSFADIDIIYKNTQFDIDNLDLLELFLQAKQLEGCSKKTLRYYHSTIDKMLIKIDKKIEDIQTADLRNYLNEYRYSSNVSKTTMDNIRRILSSFFTWLEQEDYILKNPVKRIKKGKSSS